MNTEQTHDRLPCGIEGALKLALVAAPFVAAGVGEEEAIRRAYALIVAAELHISKMVAEGSRPDFISPQTVGIDGAMQYVGLKSSRRRLKELLLAVRGRNFRPDGEELWKRADAGERVFTWKIQCDMKELRQKEITARGRAATAARLERVKKKRAMKSSL